MTKKLKKLIKRIIIGAVLFVVGLLLSKLGASVPVVKWIGIGILIASYLVLAFDILKQAGVNIIHGRVFDENFLMTVATIGAFACKEFTEAVAVMLFYQIGEAFQTYAVNKSRKSISALMDIRPDFARILVDGEEKEVDPSEAKIGDIIRIKPGERIPLDGIVRNGNSAIDTAAITGESLPRDVQVGDNIVSGCVNMTGLIDVEVTSEFGASTVSKILTLVEEASAKKANAEKFITVFAKVYTPIIVACAAILIIGGSIVTKDPMTWVYRGMTFLLISCPCALVISIPLSFFGGIGGAGHAGILIKGGNYMDVLAKIDTLVLDKTGTITKGNFVLAECSVSDFYKDKYGEAAEDKLLEFSALSENWSTHPIAMSIVTKYGKEIDKDRIESINEIAGKGVEAHIEGNIYYVGNMKLMRDVLPENEIRIAEECECHIKNGTLVYVAENDHLAGHMHIVDEIKEDSKEAIANCKKVGINKVIMLTGDNEKVASVVAKEVGLDGFKANLSPLDKVTAIEEILEENKNGKVAFVGDGINDAPVLSRADLGIAMGGMGSDAAIEAADVVIMTDELSKIVDAKKIARKTLRIVKENIGFALGIKVLVLILAAFGATSMWAAIFADVGVAFLAIMNAMRALKAPRK